MSFLESGGLDRVQLFEAKAGIIANLGVLCLTDEKHNVQHLPLVLPSFPECGCRIRQNQCLTALQIDFGICKHNIE